MNTKRLSALTLSVVSLTVVAGCGSSSDSGSGHDMSMMSTSTSSSSAQTQARFNDADVHFATQMIPHHEQAVQMAELAATRGSSPQVKALAAQIEKAQGPEIAQMSGWLKSWGKPVPTSMAGHDMGSMGSSDMPGMMSTKDMDTLKQSSGAAFDTMFLTMMIAHHEGAIEMAKQEEAQGSNPDATKLAGQIRTSQSAEIVTMKKLLA